MHREKENGQTDPLNAAAADQLAEPHRGEDAPALPGILEDVGVDRANHRVFATMGLVRAERVAVRDC